MIHLMKLDQAERSQLLALAEGLEAGYRDFPAFAYCCWRAGTGLPERLARSLYAVRQGDGRPLLVRGLPVPAPLPATPTRRDGTWTAATLRARTLMALALSPLGHLYNFRRRRAFDVIDDVFPIYVDRDSQVGTNRCFLDWHVEDGFHPAKADLLALYCLRGDPDALTYLCNARDLDLPQDVHKALQRPDYLLRTDPTMTTDSPPVRVAVLTPGSDPEIVYDPAYMYGCTPEAQHALETLRPAVQRAACSVALESGDLLVIDNRRTLHARGEYRPSYDGTDRWLLRALMLESLWPKRQVIEELECGLSDSTRAAPNRLPPKPVLRAFA